MTRSSWVIWFVSGWVGISSRISRILQRGATPSARKGSGWPAASSDGPPEKYHGKGERLFLRYSILLFWPMAEASGGGRHGPSKTTISFNQQETSLQPTAPTRTLRSAIPHTFVSFPFAIHPPRRQR